MFIVYIYYSNPLSEWTVMIYQACVSHYTCCYCRCDLCTNHICISLHHTSLSIRTGSWLMIQVGVQLAWTDLDLKLLYHMHTSVHTQTPQLSGEIAWRYTFQYSLWQFTGPSVKPKKKPASCLLHRFYYFGPDLIYHLLRCNMEKENPMMKMKWTHTCTYTLARTCWLCYLCVCVCVCVSDREGCGREERSRIFPALIISWLSVCPQG